MKILLFYLNLSFLPFHQVDRFYYLSGKLKNDELGIEINIVESDSIIKNELKKNGLLFDFSNEIEIRQGDIIIFYISRKK